MTNPQKKSEQKSGKPSDVGKDNKTQAKKDKERAAKKRDEKKDASGKSSKKSGCC